MIQTTNESLGFKFKVTSVPETVEECDAAFKKEGATLKECIDNVTYRRINNLFRNKLVAAAEEMTGVTVKSEPIREPKENESADDVPQRYTETDAVYLKRLVAEEHLTTEDIQELANSISIDFIEAVTQREPTAREPRLSKTYLEAATKYFNEGKAEKLAHKLEHNLKLDKGSIVLTGALDADKVTLAKYLIADRKRIEAESLAGV